MCLFPAGMHLLDMRYKARLYCYAAINVMPHPPQCGFGVGLAGAIDE